MHSPAERIPAELLEIILGYASTGSLASSTQVCQRWNELAIGRLWKNMSSPRPLLELLAPLESNQEGKHTLWVLKASDLVRADWTKFDRHASKVVSLTYDESEEINATPDSYIPESTFSMVAAFNARPSSSLLPNLKALSWKRVRPSDDRAAPSILHFLSPNLTSLNIAISLDQLVDWRITTKTFWGCLKGRTNSITNLGIKVTQARYMTGTEIPEWLSTCRRLRSITLPRHWNSIGLAGSLATLPELVNVHVDRRSNPATWLSPGDDDFLSVWAENNTFPVLKKLSFDTEDLAEMIGHLQSSPKFSQLQSVSIGSEGVRMESNRMAEMMSILVDKCQSLSCITVHLMSHPDLFTDHADLTFHPFRSLLSATLLTEVVIRHDSPISVEPEDFENMGKAWPKLTRLGLQACYKLHKPDFPGMGMERLEIVAEHLPHLHHLGLHFHPQRPPPFSGNLNARRRFTSLQTLSAGTSVVPGEAGIVGFFLASMCPEDLQISCSTFDMRKEDIERWKRVQEEFGLAVRVKRWNARPTDD